MNKYQETVWADVREFMPDYVDWTKLEHKNVLITGASGLIASYLVYMFMCRNRDYRQHIQIYAIMRDECKAKEWFSNIWFCEEFHPLIQDVCDEVGVDVKFDYIIHAASPASKKLYLQYPVDVWQANVVGTNLLLKRCVRDNAIFLYVSSGMLYGVSNVKRYFIEDDASIKEIPLEMKNVYVDAKRAGELLCLAFSHQYQISSKIARIFSVFGPGESINSDRCFMDFLCNVLNQESIKLKGDGMAVRSYCYVADAAAGLITLLLNGENETYNIGSKNNVFSILELKNIFSEFLSYGEVFQSKNIIDCKDYFLPDVRKLVELGWQEKTSIREIIQKCLRIYK